jgi:pyruvate dehydrogenase kinase 2/3/4
MQLWRKQMNLKLRASREISERKQVGDAEGMINEGINTSGHDGFFKGDGGEV